MNIYRYSKREGIDPSALDKEKLMDELKQKLMAGGDLDDSLWEMQHEGVEDLMEQLDRMQQSQLEKYEFSSLMEEVGRKLDDIVEMERAGIQKRLEEARRGVREDTDELSQEVRERLAEVVENRARQNLEKLDNLPQERGGQIRELARYDFMDDEARRQFQELVEALQKIKQLEEQLRKARRERSLDSVDEDLLKELMGDKAAEELQELRNMTRVLEEAGYIRRRGDKYELTPRGMLRIGQKTLQDIFGQLRKDSLGDHVIDQRGIGVEMSDETKEYEFGDTFCPHLERTIMNALYRERQVPPIKLSSEDFEVFRREQMARSATVLMLDLSVSMERRGNFTAAKQVTIALDTLIRSRYTKDSLYVVGFSTSARQMEKGDLWFAGWDEFEPYTNMQQAFILARKLLARDRCANKQIILVSDGEPTAHIEEDGSIFFQYPPSPRTLQMTLREVRSCTRKGIVINAFMLESSDLPFSLRDGPTLNAFVTQMVRINRGRVFFTPADRLGRYLLMDYVSGRIKKIH